MYLLPFVEGYLHGNPALETFVSGGMCRIYSYGIQGPSIHHVKRTEFWEGLVKNQIIIM